MSTEGLEGVLPWSAAHQIANTCAQPLPAVRARLDEASGSLLASSILMLDDDPAENIAAVNGYALCGQGPWRRTPEETLAPGECFMVRAGTPMPEHADAVLPLEQAVSEQGRGNIITVTGRDILSGLADERVRPAFGDGVMLRGSRTPQGTQILPAGRLVTAAVLALMAAAGHDDVPIVRPPIVGTLVLGSSLLTSGGSRQGRARDALGDSVPAFVAALGARANPAVRAPDIHEVIRAEIEDANVDVLITTGSTAPDSDNSVRHVLRDLDARWLIDGVAVTPGAQMLLARLPDGRLVVGLPGSPQSAFAGLVTLVSPIIRALRGVPRDDVYPTAVLVDDAPRADFANDTRLASVRLEDDGADGLHARPMLDSGPAGLIGWGNADAIAIVPPGTGIKGDIVSVIML